MKNRHKIKFVAYGLLLAIVLFVSAGAVFYKADYEKQPKIDGNRILAPYIYNFYVSNNPGIQNNLYYGNENASITIISFLSFDSEASRNFMENVFPAIKEDYIDNGHIRYYPRNFLSLGDIENKNNNYRYSMALLCISKLGKENYYDFYFELLKSVAEKAPILAKKYKIPENEFDDCLKDSSNLNQLYRNALEIERLGMVGINQRFYIGIVGRDNTVINGLPNYLKLQDTIRQHQIRIGN